MTSSGRSASLWMESTHVPEYPAVRGHAAADVCVVGAGIAGLATAYLLAREQCSVIVLDGGRIGGGETGRTTAHLSNALDDRYAELERLHGDEGARMAAESHTAAIDRIEKIVAEEAIECEFERLDGYLFNAPGMSTETLQDELAAAHRAGLACVEMVERAPLDSFDTGPALRFPQQAQFHPLRYISGLARAVESRGGRLFSGSRADRIEGGVNARVWLLGGAVVTAGAVVVATNAPVNDRIAIHTKQAPYRTYVVGAKVPQGSIRRALYWDTDDPYHYVRLHPCGSHRGAAMCDVLMVGGEDHKTGQDVNPAEHYRRLEAWTRERFPVVDAIEFHWSGQVLEPVDGLAFIGRDPGDADNVYIVTGDSGHGMTHGTIAGMLLSDLIQGRHNRWASLYDPARVRLKSGTEFLRENLNVAARYGEWLTPGEVSIPEDIPPGAGAVLRHGLVKIAAYRDERGLLHQRSAVCPHLGCIVSWNRTEKTWDCPCHGSRFDPYGRVLNGPANRDLAPIVEPVRKAA